MNYYEIGRREGRSRGSTFVRVHRSANRIAAFASAAAEMVLVRPRREC